MGFFMYSKIQQTGPEQSIGLCEFGGCNFEKSKRKYLIKMYTTEKNRSA